MFFYVHNYMQIFGYPPLKIQGTAILLGRTNLAAREIIITAQRPGLF